MTQALYAHKNNKTIKKKNKQKPLSYSGFGSVFLHITPKTQATKNR
jgi:hypothetical protein